MSSLHHPPMPSATPGGPRGSPPPPEGAEPYRKRTNVRPVCTYDRPASYLEVIGTLFRDVEGLLYSRLSLDLNVGKTLFLHIKTMDSAIVLRVLFKNL